jgi:hypothetical protein
MVRLGQASTAPRAEGNFNSAATAIVNHQAVAAVHFCNEGIGTVRTIRVDDANPVEIVVHSSAAWNRSHGAMWRQRDRESNVRYPSHIRHSAYAHKQTLGMAVPIPLAVLG